ncbi:MAG: leucine-rich repeat domain-containing protein [Ruminococcus sp.]|uniref:leucine-rich repeat domain-containing protein n=1 Tax=Ruminococcus sp. TaxID=41978 RepID=UPI001B1C5FB9|nr:leucine-rich repeat domain-containing protein [Ruminococcus sp.]MBO7472964.1 leucine-rich repeat domain-containing protein [Ruminococcus sp.]
MKKTVFAIASTIMMTLSLSINPKEVICATEMQYEYTIINNQATITGYKGKPVYIDIPETIEGCQVVEIRDNAFYECSTLKHIDLPETIQKIGHHSFYACSALEDISIPDSVTDIGMGCFCGCSELNSAALPETLTALPESCFRSCISLVSITVPEDVEKIGDFCFSGCTSLKNISLGNKLINIGDCSFYMCSSLKGIYVPPSVSNIGICALGYIPGENGAEVSDMFMLLGDEDSAVHTYARDNHITFNDASDTVQAFAIQRISGERVPISIPSVIIIIVIILTALAIIFFKRKDLLSSKAKINIKGRK